MKLLLKTNAYFSRFYCNKNLPSSFRTGAGLRPKKCGAGAGWYGLRGGCGCGLEVCGAGAGNISQTPAGRERTQNFNPRRTLIYTFLYDLGCSHLLF